MRRILVAFMALAMTLGFAPVAANAATPVKKLPPSCSQKYVTEKTSATIGTFFVTAECNQLGMQPTALSAAKIEICAIGPVLGGCPKWLPWKVSSVKAGDRPSAQSVAAKVNIRIAPGVWTYRLTMKGTYRIYNRPPLVAQTIYFTNSHRQGFSLL